MVPLIGPGYRPVDADERGLWQQYARVEEEIAGSNLLIKDPALTTYLRDLIGKVGGPAAKDMRIYLARIPDFNAVMFPTGFSVIFSGLLLRMRNEAQLAGVIAHESGHFLRRHQIRQWRDMRRKTDIFSILAVGAGVAGAGAGVYTGDLARLGQLGTILSLLQYNRTLEAEADAMGARLLAENGYPPDRDGQYLAAIDRRGEIVRQIPPQAAPARHFLILDASVAGSADGRPQAQRARADRSRARLRRWTRPLSRRDRRHPPDAARRPGQIERPGRQPVHHQYPRQGRLERPAALSMRRRSGACATAPATICARRQGYAAAVAFPDAPADAWRWHGLMLTKQGRTAEGRAALSRYLAMKPNAPDAPFVRQMLAQAELIR